MNTLGRRQRQAKQGYKHTRKQQRPHYKKRSAESSAAHEARLAITRNKMQQGKNKKK